MVGRENAHHRLRVDRLQDVRGQADRRSRVALRRLGQDLLFRNLGKLFHDLRAQMIVGENPDAFGR